MLLFIQLILSIVLTTLYGIHQNISFDISGILTLLLAFILSFLIVFVVFFLFYIPYILASEKTSKTGRVKHILINMFGKYVFVYLFRVKMIVTGKENLPKNNKFVIYMNHIEFTDPIYVKFVYHKFPVSYVAKESLFKVFLVKNLIRSVGAVPINREVARSAMRSIVESINIVKSGQPMGIFPEGTRSYSNTPIDFKPGAFKLAMNANADISPVCLYNMHGIMKKCRVFTHKVYIHVCPLIPYEEFKDMDSTTISEKVRGIIVEKLDDFKQRIPEN